MKYVTAFIAGLAFPATLFPITYFILYIGGLSAVRTLPLQFLPLFIPLVFGFWNVLYFMLWKRCPVKDRNQRLLATGASLGLLLALFGVFVIRLPVLLFGFTGPMQYIPLIIVPAIYALVWRYIIKYLNDLLGLKDW